MNDAFAKFFKRAGKDPKKVMEEQEKLEQERREQERLEKERREKEKLEKLEREKAEREKAAKAAAKAGSKPKARSPSPSPEPSRSLSPDAEGRTEARAKALGPPPTGDAPAAPGLKEAKEPAAGKSEPREWPKRTPERAPKSAEEEPKLPQKGLALPPPGTVTKKTDDPWAEPLPPEDDGERVQEVSPLDHRFVGLVIGKAGETIKSFKKQSGASIEIDQNLPDGMPRVVIYRGTKRQVAIAKRLVDALVQRAKEDEKTKAASATGAGMGILGRGPAGKLDMEREAAEKAARAAGANGDEKLPPWELPPWRRTRPEEEPRPGGPAGPGAAPGPPGRRDVPWAKREKEVEAAPSGSLTGAPSLGGGMRPAWMKSKEEKDDGTIGPFDRCNWHEQKYSRMLMMQAKQKILRSKAYEVPAEMMTMTTGIRPKWKAEKEKEKKEKEAVHDEPVGPRAEREASPPPWLRQSSGNQRPHGEEDGAGEAAAAEEAAEGREGEDGAGRASGVPGPYENLPGDSKDILKLKKKLREIQKIEESIATGEHVAPNQVEKVTKKAGYLEELRLLESIVRTPGSGVA